MHQNERREAADGEPPRSPPAPTADRGFSLVEAIVTITLTSLVVVGILAAVRASVKSSRVVYDAAELETVLINAADRVDRAEQLCDYEDYVDAAALAANWPVSALSASVETLVANTGDPANDWAAQPCPADVRPFDVQRIVITATSPNGGITRTMTVVKSDVE